MERQLSWPGVVFGMLATVTFTAGMFLASATNGFSKLYVPEAIAFVTPVAILIALGALGWFLRVFMTGVAYRLTIWALVCFILGGLLAAAYALGSVVLSLEVGFGFSTLATGAAFLGWWRDGTMVEKHVG